MSDSDSSTRLCTKCGRDLPATTEFFYKEKTGALGLCSQCKDCRGKDAQVWRRANAERLSAQNRAWRAAHPGYDQAKWVTYDYDRTEYHRAYREAHRAENAEYSRVYRLEHPDYHANFRQEHPERYLAYSRNRRAREQECEGEHTAEHVRAQYDRQKGKCFYCHEKMGEKYEVDHVIPLVRGGSNGPENLVVACRACNRAKAAKHPMDFCGKLL